jgi:predicted ATPase
MNTKKLLSSIRLGEFLSYGPKSERLSLGQLNVIIGPNGSGKSNLIEALAVLQAVPRELPKPIREGGGITEWLWKGPHSQGVAQIEITTAAAAIAPAMRYRISFTQSSQRFLLDDESIENEERTDPNHEDVYFYYRYQHGHPAINTRSKVEDNAQDNNNWYQRALKRDAVSSDNSILSQRKDAELYPEMTWLGEQFASMKLYREWSFGRATAPRRPQQVDMPEDFLMEDGSNLGLVLNDLLHRGRRRTIIDKLAVFYDGIDDISTKVHGGTIQVFVHETGMQHPIPATRLSDGTLRYLCLICILCHPDPPGLICIEEPELGIHPDILPQIGEMLVEASQRTQLIVTTHSDALVSALGDRPDDVIVCEKDANGTHLRHLDPEKLNSWLKEYSLGEVWRMGEIGGNRW